MTIKASTIVSLGAIMVTLATQYGHLLPEDLRPVVPVVVAAGQAIQALVVHHRNPDGTPAEAAWDKSTAKNFRPEA